MVTVPGWTYKGHIVNDISDMPKNTYGFIYETKHIPSGQKYLGKKVLFFERNKRLGKRALQALKEERAKKGLKGRVPLKQKVITESDWKDYYGSSDRLNEDIGLLGKEKFKREIMFFCTSKAQCNYIEAREQFAHKVLESDEWYNGHIRVRVHKFK